MTDISLKSALEIAVLNEQCAKEKMELALLTKYSILYCKTDEEKAQIDSNCDYLAQCINEYFIMQRIRSDLEA